MNNLNTIISRERNDIPANGGIYPWDENIVSTGKAITHTPGSSIIALSPNQIYSVTYSMTLRNDNDAVISPAGVQLNLNGNQVPGSYSQTLPLLAGQTGSVSNTVLVKTGAGVNNLTVQNASNSDTTAFANSSSLVIVKLDQPPVTPVTSVTSVSPAALNRLATIDPIRDVEVASPEITHETRS